MKWGKYLFIVTLCVLFLPIGRLHAQTKNIASEQLDIWIQSATRDTKPSDLQGYSFFSQEIVNAQNAGVYKFPKPSYKQAGIVCNNIKNADPTQGYVFDGTAKQSCDQWQADIAILEAKTIHYYKQVLYLKTATNKNIPLCGTATVATAVNCLPTEAHIQELKNKVDADLNTLKASAKLANTESANDAAKQLLDDSGCQPDNEVAKTLPAGADIPNADFTVQYKKDHPGQPVPSCQELRNEVAKTAAERAQAEKAIDAGSGGSCSFSSFDLGGCLLSIMGYIVAAIEWVILLIAAALLGLANYLLGWIVYISIFQFGNLIGNSEGLLAAWGVVRDVSNILLLFGFIFMGVSTILNLPHSEFTAKKALPRLIVFALLMNFSLLATEGLIDVSNAFATSIYTQISGGNVCQNSAAVGDSAQASVDSALNSTGGKITQVLAGPAGVATGAVGGTVAGDVASIFDCAMNNGIGGRLMAMSGVTGIFSFGNDQAGAKFPNGESKAIVYGGLIVFVIITTLVLITAAVMLLIRALILALLMVTSPIGFAGMAVPPLQEMAHKWWKQLFDQAIFAPVYFLLALVSFKIMEGVMSALNVGAGTGNDTSTQNLASIFGNALGDGKISNITIGITFALIIGFMIASLIFAKKSSAIGSGLAIAAGGSLAFGGLGIVGRNTVGRASLLAGNRIRSSRFGETGLGRIAFNVANKGASSSFDYRQGGLGRKALGDATGGLGEVRKGVQHGIHGIEEDKKKARIEYAKNLKQSHEEGETEARLKANKENLESDKATYQNGRKQEEDRLKQEVADQTQLMAQNGAARGRNIAAVQAELTQAITNNNQAATTRLQGQLNQMLAVNAQEMAVEQQELDRRKAGLQAHQTDTKNRIAQYDNDIADMNTQISGGTHRDLQGNKTTYDGVTLDAKKKRYGKNLQNSVLANYAHKVPGSEMWVGAISGHADYEAGREVIRNAGRTGTERALHDLQNALSTAGNQGGQGGGANAGGGNAGGGHAPAHP